MKNEISYQEAKNLLDKYLKTEFLRFHSRETEVVMRRLAKHFNENQDFWGISGLLHDLDLDILQGNFALHGLTTVKILREEGFEIPELFAVILSHTEGIPESTAKRVSNFDIILSAAENITGLISANTLLRPDKKIAGTEPKSLVKRLKSKAFAASVNREFIYDIEKTGISLNDFLQIAIDAMTEIADEIRM